MPIQKIKSGRVLNPELDGFIGNKGQLFFDEDTGELRLSDGITAGGVPISGGVSPVLVYNQGSLLTNNLKSLNFLTNRIFAVDNDISVSLDLLLVDGGTPDRSGTLTVLPAFLNLPWDGSSIIDLGGVT